MNEFSQNCLPCLGPDIIRAHRRRPEVFPCVLYIVFVSKNHLFTATIQNRNGIPGARKTSWLNLTYTIWRSLRVPPLLLPPFLLLRCRTRPPTPPPPPKKNLTIRPPRRGTLLRFRRPSSARAPVPVRVPPAHTSTETTCSV